VGLFGPKLAIPVFGEAAKYEDEGLFIAGESDA
jgi:hypothetical protein